jgi:hypothetical protein
MSKRPCTCCGGTGRVESACGDLRPCTRCQSHEAFQAWARRLLSPPPAPVRGPISRGPFDGGDAA